MKLYYDRKRNTIFLTNEKTKENEKYLENIYLKCIKMRSEKWVY